MWSNISIRSSVIIIKIWKESVTMNLRRRSMEVDFDSSRGEHLGKYEGKWENE